MSGSGFELETISLGTFLAWKWFFVRANGFLKTHLSANNSFVWLQVWMHDTV